MTSVVKERDVFIKILPSNRLTDFKRLGCSVRSEHGRFLVSKLFNRATTNGPG